MIATETAQHVIVSKLLDGGHLTFSQLESAHTQAEIAGIPLVEQLLTDDLVSDADVAQVYADMRELRFVDLSRRSPAYAWALTLPENIARRKNCIVFGEVGGQLVVAVADPVDPSVRAAVSTCFDRPIQYVVSPRFQIIDTIDEIYGAAREKGARISDAVPVSTSVATASVSGINIVEVFDSIVDEAVDRRASDIHIEPEEDRLRMRFRIDGRLIEARAYPVDLAAQFISRVKVLSGMDITERRRPQDGRFSHRSFEQEIDVRVAIIPTARGERVTLRLLASKAGRISLENLGMGAELRQAFERLIHRPHGIILLTGPTGSGKSTTLYAALQCINTIDKHIITIEDPVEYDIAGINQVAVDAEHGVSFSAALRSILRHDPDIVMVGEIRDQQTAHLALEASLTGHLVFATLHTNSAAGAVTRLIDMGCEPYLVASGLIGVLAQRLVRRICANCKRSYEPNLPERKIMGFPPDRTNVHIYRGAGCARCLRTGYYDRVGVFEYLPFDTGLSDLIMLNATTEKLQEHGAAHGAITLREDAVSKIRDGLTTVEEALRVTLHE